MQSADFLNGLSPRLPQARSSLRLRGLSGRAGSTHLPARVMNSDAAEAKDVAAKARPVPAAISGARERRAPVPRTTTNDAVSAG